MYEARKLSDIPRPVVWYLDRGAEDQIIGREVFAKCSGGATSISFGHIKAVNQYGSNTFVEIDTGYGVTGISVNKSVCKDFVIDRDLDGAEYIWGGQQTRDEAAAHARQRESFASRRRERYYGDW